MVFFIGTLAWAYQATRPPPSKLCGSPGAPPITAPRIKLKDGRYLAYKEHGVPRDKAKYKIVFVHGFGGCRHDVPIAATLSPVILLFCILSASSQHSFAGICKYSLCFLLETSP